MKRKFIDLFSGIGAFHQALKEKNFECSIAVEIDKHAIDTYSLNYPETNILNDITKVSVVNEIVKTKNIDMITAGFPCQPFSKAGNMTGLQHKSGNLFYNIIDLVKKYNLVNKPIKYLFFENVGFLKNHDDSLTWEEMKKTIIENNYEIIHNDIITNPIQLGIPQNRVRMFLFCVHKNFVDEYKSKNQLNYKNLDLIFLNNKCDLYSALKYIENVNNEKVDFIDLEHEQILNIWEEFVKITKIKNLGFPIWLRYFGIGEDNSDEFIKNTIKKETKMYDWKRKFLERNRAFYIKHKNVIDLWYKKYKDFLLKKLTYQKFEWNANGTINSIKDGIIQFRHSGIRVKKPDFFPTLVKMVHTPIIWDKKYNGYRYLSLNEALKLQNFPIEGPQKFKFPDGYSSVEAFKRIGNSINVKVISTLLDFLLEYDSDDGGKINE